MKEGKIEHYAIKCLQNFLVKNPSANWAKEWINCFAYQCSCEKCLALLKKNNVDINMLDRIFSELTKR